MAKTRRSSARTPLPLVQMHTISANGPAHQFLCGRQGLELRTIVGNVLDMQRWSVTL
jgi:hypothetical protein